MLKLGQVGRRREIVRFRDWVSENNVQEIAGQYPITGVLLPNKYPSGAFLFIALHKGEEAIVKITVKADTFKEVLKTAGFRKGKDIIGKKLYFTLTKQGEYGIDVAEDDDSVYVFIGTGWKLMTRQEWEEAQEEEVDF